MSKQMERYRQGTLQTIGSPLLQEAKTVPRAVEELPGPSVAEVRLGILRGEWTVEDDRRLLELVLENGSRWSNISKILKTRT